MRTTIPKLLQHITTKYGDTPAQYIKDSEGTFHPRTYSALYNEVLAFAAGLKNIGVSRGDHVGLISENRAEWFVTDLALLSLGAADVPRGNDSVPQELHYILDFAGCKTVVVENHAQLSKLSGIIKELKAVKTIIVLDQNFDPDSLDGDSKKPFKRVKLLRYQEIVESGKSDGSHRAVVESEISEGQPDDTATIIFTSGTTGTPKGVVLSHHNFLHQVNSIDGFLDVNPGDVWLAVLPVWHSFERIMQYIALGTASALAYSKPVAKIMLGDFAQVQPQWMGSVPRIWESVRSGIIKKTRAEGGIKWAMFRFFVAVGGAHKHATDLVRGRVPRFKPRSRALDFVAGVLPWLVLWPFAALGSALVFSKIKARLGGRFVAGISGGGALPSAVDQFFGAAGILLLEGYGLTETAPVIAVRKQHHPVPGTVGTLIPDTECEIRDENGNALPAGTQGVVYVKGPQVMSGYYNAPEQTRAVLSDDGWFNTGDLGMMTVDGELKITGRAKDTIVLRGGENIEPLPIEQKLRESELIDQAVVLGQDQKFLAALIVPNEEALQEALRQHAEASGSDKAGTKAGSHTIVAQADGNGATSSTLAQLIDKPESKRIIESEVSELVSIKNGFRGFEQIYRVLLAADQFEIGHELSAKQEVKRHVINEKYEREIAKLFE